MGQVKNNEFLIGCMRVFEMENHELQSYMEAAINHGITSFDHADIYGGGQCESKFGEVLKESSIKREDIYIQSKCGIIPRKMYDLSYEHIVGSVEGSLKRLQTPYLDALLLHRPDALVEPEEVARAFDYLQQQGMVRNFGVSNHNPLQIELLKKYVKQGLHINQLQFSIVASTMVSSGIEVNMITQGAINRDQGVLDYCRLHDIKIQAWSPYQIPGFQGCFLDHEMYVKLNSILETLGNKYGVSKTCIATAWILRHPANMQVIIGTTKKSRLDEIVEANKVTLTKDEWYEIYLSCGNILP
ncbi:MAG: aldo/keto reductase [Lachnospiraceae bacterium]